MAGGLLPTMQEGISECMYFRNKMALSTEEGGHIKNYNVFFKLRNGFFTKVNIILRIEKLNKNN